MRPYSLRWSECRTGERPTGLVGYLVIADPKVAPSTGQGERVERTVPGGAGEESGRRECQGRCAGVAGECRCHRRDQGAGVAGAWHRVQHQ